MVIASYPILLLVNALTWTAHVFCCEICFAHSNNKFTYCRTRQPQKHSKVGIQDTTGLKQASYERCLTNPTKYIVLDRTNHVWRWTQFAHLHCLGSSASLFRSLNLEEFWIYLTGCSYWPFRCSLLVKTLILAKCIHLRYTEYRPERNGKTRQIKMFQTWSFTSALFKLGFVVWNSKGEQIQYIWHNPKGQLLIIYFVIND